MILHQPKSRFWKNKDLDIKKVKTVITKNYS